MDRLRDRPSVTKLACCLAQALLHGLPVRLGDDHRGAMRCAEQGSAAGEYVALEAFHVELGRDERVHGEQSGLLPQQLVECAQAHRLADRRVRLSICQPMRLRCAQGPAPGGCARHRFASLVGRAEELAVPRIAIIGTHNTAVSFSARRAERQRKQLHAVSEHRVGAERGLDGSAIQQHRFHSKHTIAMLCKKKRVEAKVCANVHKCANFWQPAGATLSSLARKLQQLIGVLKLPMASGCNLFGD